MKSQSILKYSDRVWYWAVKPTGRTQHSSFDIEQICQERHLYLFPFLWTYYLRVEGMWVEVIKKKRAFDRSTPFEIDLVALGSFRLYI